MSLFVYSPSIAGACVAAIALVLVMIAMLFFNKKTRSLVLAPFLFAMMLEAAAAIARSSYSTHPDSLHTFYVAYFLPILAPTFVAAGSYVLFARLMWYTTPLDQISTKTLWVWPRWSSYLFIFVDLIGFAVQIIGVVKMAHCYTRLAKDDMENGLKDARYALQVGNVIHMVLFTKFAFLTVRYGLISRKWLKARAAHMHGTTKQLRTLLAAICLSALLLMGHSIYIVYQFAHKTGPNADAYVITHEWPFWLFEFLPSVFICILFTLVAHPSKALPKQFLGIRLGKNKAESFRKDETWHATGSQWPSNQTLPVYNTSANSSSDGLIMEKPAPVVQKKKKFVLF